MRQLNLVETVVTETDIYTELKPALESVIHHNRLSVDWLRIERGKQYSSVWFSTQMAFRICSRGGHCYFGVANTYCNNLKDCIRNSIMTANASEGFTNFEFDPQSEDLVVFSEFLAHVLDQVIDAIPKEFDCCSRYQECSDAKHCIHPNPAVALICGYRKIMKRGRIFYGSNRNID